MQLIKLLIEHFHVHAYANNYIISNEYKRQIHRELLQ